MSGFACNGLPGVIAWACVIALFWLALCLPAPKVKGGKVAKIALLAAFGGIVFLYVMR